MRRRWVWQSAIALSIVAALAFGALWWYGTRLQKQATITSAMIPATATILAGVDVAAVRSAGLIDQIAGSVQMETPEYRRFVNEIHFDYRKDLDYAVAGMAPEVNYFVLRGRFDHDALEAYAKAGGGACRAEFCHARTDSGKVISFYKADGGTLALAIGSDPDAVRAMTAPPPDRAAPPAGMVWAVVEKPALQDETSTFATYLAMFGEAERLTAWVAPAVSGVSMQLSAESHDPAIRARIANDFSKILQGLNRRSSPPLIAALAQGKVTSTADRVDVVWSLNGRMLTALLLGEKGPPQVSP